MGRRKGEYKREVVVGKKEEKEGRTGYIHRIHCILYNTVHRKGKW